MIESSELIERWENAERVLVAMPEHERQHHWNMSTYGEQHKCGTVACAAGHCGLDTWFRERDFRLDFYNGRMSISNVPAFFGLVGTSRIFWNTAARPVENVIGEVREYITELRRIAALTADPMFPKIGEEWPEHGGVFAGACLGRDGAPDYVLIVGPQAESHLNWDEAMAWAAALEVEGHKDFTLPDRLEQPVLFDRVRSLFQPTYYWSRTQHASYSDYAWFQYFYDGCQDHWNKNDELRARAVRRLPIR